MYGPVQGNSPYKLAYMQVFPDNPFWQTMKEAVEARAAEDGVTVDTFALPTASGVADQVSQMENAVTQQYDGIILGTVDAAGIVPGIEAANAAGIPVIAVDTAPAGGDFISLVQTDNVAAARLAGEFIAEQIGGTGKVLNLQGDLANQTGQARNEGLHAGPRRLPRYPGHRPEHDVAQGPKGLTITENILTSDPDIVAIFAANDPPALGALQALKAAGRDDVLIVGFDGTEDGLAGGQGRRLRGRRAAVPGRDGDHRRRSDGPPPQRRRGPGAGRFRLRSGHGGERRPVSGIVAQKPSEAVVSPGSSRRRDPSPLPMR